MILLYTCPLGEHMRYADGPSAEVEVHIDARPDAVWLLVTDIELPARFSPELQRVRWLDNATESKLGATFEGHNENHMLGSWRTVSVITEMSPPVAFGWVVTDVDGRFGPANTDPAHPIAAWRFALEPEDGTTRLRLAARLGPARSGLNLAIDNAPDKEEAIIDGRLAMLRDGMQRTLDGIKQLAEAG